MRRRAGVAARDDAGGTEGNVRYRYINIALLAALLALLAGCAAPVRVTWKTETEMNTAGFNLYRSTSPDGPFAEKVNEQLIPPSADPLTGKEYSYVDTVAQAGVTYYYQLQEVERNGNVNTFGPITVRTSGLEWPQVALLVGLAAIVLLIWVRGGKVLQKARANG
jgi:hypothetical protein